MTYLKINKTHVKISISFIGQFAALFIPTILYPLIIQKFGVGSFGELMTFLALLPVFNQLADFGLNVYAARELSLTSEQDNETEIFWKIFNTRLLSSLISVAIFFLFSYWSGMSEKSFHLTWTTGAVILTMGFIPNYYFIARGNFHIIPLIPALHKTIYVVLVSFFINYIDQLWVINQLNFIIMAFILMGVYWRIFVVYGSPFSFDFKVLDWGAVRKLLNVFSSNVLISIYTASPVFLLASLYGSNVVGNYGFAEKLMLGGKAFVTLFATIVYTKLCNHFSMRKVIIKYYLPFVIMMSCAVFTVFLEADKIVELLKGPTGSVRYLKIVIWTLLPVALNSFFYQVILARGFYNLARNIILVAVLSSIVILAISVRYMGELGAARGLILSEIVFYALTVMGFIKVKRGEIDGE